MSPPQQKSTRIFVQMSGAPGSGKSTLARLLRPAINAIVIDHDVLRSCILESELVTFDQAAKQAYSLQWALARDVMKQGVSVIIDSTCNYPEVLTQGSALASEYNYVYWYVECRVRDIDLLDARLRTRDPMASQRTAVDNPPVAARSTRSGDEAYALFTKWIENPCRPDEHAIIVDSTAQPDVLRDDVLQQMAVPLADSSERIHLMEGSKDRY